MGTLTRNKDGNKASAAPGHAADPARPGISDAVASTEPATDEKSGESSSKPVRSARRPPAVPPPFGGGGNIGGGSGDGGAGSDGFFHIRKKGQGYWTRMGTAAGAALIGALTVQFIYGEHAYFNLSSSAAYAVCGVFALIYALGVFYFMNRSTSVDFLIATDSEMKKVNWTSRKELMGSTKVVILFMFIMAAYLFLMDVLFGYFFYAIGVVKEPPF
jgi:preprotein translocase subunit SecE